MNVALTLGPHPLRNGHVRPGATVGDVGPRPPSSPASSGFSPFVLVTVLVDAHLMLGMAFVPPLVVACLDKLLVRRKRRPVAVGVLLGVSLSDPDSCPRRSRGRSGEYAKAGSSVIGGNEAGDREHSATVIATQEVLDRMVAKDGNTPAYPSAAWPTDTYITDEKELFFNGEAIQMFHQPAAHTDGDTIVFFRRSDVVSSGDIFTPSSYRSSTSRGAAPIRVISTVSITSSTSPFPPRSRKAAPTSSRATAVSATRPIWWSIAT